MGTVYMKRPVQPKRSHAARSSKEPRIPRVGPVQRKPHPDEECVSPHEKLNKIAGLPAVAALFRHDPERAVRLFFDESMKQEAGSLFARMAAMHKPYRMVSKEELTRIAGTVLHGGIVAVARPKPLLELDLVEAARWANAGQSLFILDGVGNPHNLGAIVRTLAFFGLKRLVISDHPTQAAPSDAAYRVAEGGLESVSVYRVPRLPRVLRGLKAHFRVVGTALTRQAIPIGELPADSRPLAMVLGNEEDGLPAQTLAACEVIATIPGRGTVQSLNVSAAAAILVYEMTRSSKRSKRPAPSQR